MKGLPVQQLRQVTEAHFGVGHYAEHKIVIAGNFKRGVEMAVFFVNFFAEEERRVSWHPPVGGQVQPWHTFLGGRVSFARSRKSEV
jgi:hypothetical protein